MPLAIFGVPEQESSMNTTRKTLEPSRSLIHIKIRGVTDKIPTAIEYQRYPGTRQKEDDKESFHAKTRCANQPNKDSRQTRKVLEDSQTKEEAGGARGRPAGLGPHGSPSSFAQRDLIDLFDVS